MVADLFRVKRVLQDQHCCWLFKQIMEYWFSETAKYEKKKIVNVHMTKPCIILFHIFEEPAVKIKN